MQSSPYPSQESFFHRAASIPYEAALALLGILAVKCVLLVLDPNPRFFLWDSVTYLRGALDGGLPRDRSFLYSLVIKAIAVPVHSLHALVTAQTLAGASGALLVFFLLRQILNVSLALAMAVALLIAIEPSQLFYERMVMAEAFGSVTWLIFISLVLAYCRNARLLWLPAIAAAGILAIAFRLNGTVTILVVGTLLPIWRAGLQRNNVNSTSWTQDLPRTVAHLAVAIACTAALHLGYRQIVSQIAHAPAGYIGTQGLFDLGFAAPLVEVVDFEGTGCDADVLKHFSLPLGDPANREGQLWADDGLWSAMQRDCPAPEAAATLVAHRALTKHWWRIPPMAFATVAQYFDGTEAQWRMESDIGRKGTLPIEIIEPAHDRFWLEAGPIPWTDSITSVFFQSSRWWMTGCFFLVPLMSLWTLLRARQNNSAVAAKGLALVALCLFLTQFMFSPIISFRYLHPFPPLTLMLAASILDQRKPAPTSKI